MGNTLNKGADKKAVKPSKKFNPKKDAKQPVSQQPADGPMYDTVADMALYSVVNKPRNQVVPQAEVQYAEIQVLQPPPYPRMGSQEPALSSTCTEYATIDFQPQTPAPPPPVHRKRMPRRSASSNRPPVAPKPVDIFIPQEGMHKPIPRPRLKKSHSQKGTLV